MKPDLCCDASDGDCYSVNLFDDHDIIKERNSIVIDRYHWAYVTSDGKNESIK